MKLQLPRSIKRLTHFIIRKELPGGKHLIITALAAFVAGLIISVVEVVCTAQIYLPTITYILSIPALRAKALFYLVGYNIFFIVPLVIVFLISYYRVSAKRLVI